METPPETRELILLDQIEQNPDINQSTLADQLGVAVGTVNWHIKRLVEKGAVTVKRAERKKLRYIITPEGIALRAKLTVNYIENSMLLYRRTRRVVLTAVPKIRDAGFDSVRIVGDGDLAEVVRLSCLEHGIKLGDDQSLPAFEIEGWRVKFNMEMA